MRKMLFCIAIFAFLLRFYGINWDAGFHLHPDERMLILVADKVHFWDQLNPQFFNYGSLPIYLLKGVTQLVDSVFQTQYATYDGMLFAGRVLSLFFDLGTLVLIYKITKLLFKTELFGIWSAFLYAITFFAIQNSHFFVVDVYLTFFITAVVCAVLHYLKKPTFLNIFCAAICFAAALATKATAVVFLPMIGLAFLSPILLAKKKSFATLKETALYVLSFVGLTFLFHFLFMPYAYLDFSQFITQTVQQTAMSKDPYIFPYTLQYVYTTPYNYYLKNIVLWGVGPFISLFVVAGVVRGLVHLFAQLKDRVRHLKHMHIASVVKAVWNYTEEHKLLVFFVLFYLMYFVVIGGSAVKFMRYMLPLYPFLIVCAAAGLEYIRKFSTVVAILLMVAAAFWTVSFESIYTTQHTRLSATEWIVHNVPVGSRIAVEHWDDRLPIVNSEQYQIQDLTLYDLPDDAIKWRRIEQVVSNSEYIIVASNRLYVPLQKLTDCKKYLKCYPLTAKYYQRLFDGSLGFQKVAEFSVEPTTPLFPIHINDQSADESFTVYDHPKIMIFQHHPTGVQ